jgi:hypothetical protein
MNRTLAFTALALLAGCNSPGSSYNGTGPGVAQSVAQNASNQGIVIHNRSGQEFPTSAGGFQRISVSNAAGRDIAGGYVLGLADGNGIVAVVHVYTEDAASLPGQARDSIGYFQFQTRKDMVLKQHPGATVVVPERPYPILQQGRNRAGYEAIIDYTDTLGGKRQPVRTELYSFAPAAPGFNIEYRFSYPASLDVGQSIREFMAVLPWTFRGLS